MLNSISSSVKVRLAEILIIVFLLAFIASITTSGCAVDLRARATAFEAEIHDTAQTSLTSGRVARD